MIQKIYRSKFFMKKLNYLIYVHALQQRFSRIKYFIQLARLDRPIGIYLLLWPTLWTLWITAEGLPSLVNLLFFIIGVILMRSAGCVINDYADLLIDCYVKRTMDRPLVTGSVQKKEALVFFTGIIGIAFLLVLLTNQFTIILSVIGLLLAIMYPFAKRYTYFPQIILGTAFSWSIPIVFAVENRSLNHITWLLFMANFFWTVAYDTEYAMVDRDDDIEVGIKSTAILFGKMENMIIGLLQILTLITLLIIGYQLELEAMYYLSLIVVATLFIYQQLLISHRNPNACFQAFLNNNLVGAIVFLGITLSFLFKQSIIS